MLKMTNNISFDGILLGKNNVAKQEPDLSPKRNILMDMADVIIHINESVDHDRRTEIADMIRNHKGVMGVAHHDEKPHLLIVEYDPAEVHSKELLQVALDQGVHAQLVGF